MTQDTQPRSPFTQPPTPQPPLEPEPEDGVGGPGCLVWGLFAVVALGFAVAIVGLAAAAGWAEGERLADRRATATQSGLVDEQIVRIPNDIANGNADLLGQRLSYLETVAPDLVALPDLRITATAVYVAAQPTATTPATATPTPTETAAPEVTAESTEAVVVEDAAPTSPAQRFDLDGLLTEARRQIAADELEDAYETLDAIVRIDSNYQPAVVEDLLADTLLTLATRLYRSENTLAEAIYYTGIAENFDIAIGDLSYERLIAGLYLDIQNAVASDDHPTAIRLLNEVRGYQTSYQGQDFNRLLFNEYVAYGDAFVAGNEPCRSLTHYDQALRLFADNGVQAKRSAAQAQCSQGTIQQTVTPGTPAPGAPVPTQQPIAPIGVPGT
jgi:tetratricopeptide (TPR) repeat protein